MCKSSTFLDLSNIGHSRSFSFTPAEAEKMAREAKEKGEENYKGDSKFASHLKASTGVSSFAKSRTLKEQREYLPAFACREELMKVIREHQGLKPAYFLYQLTIIFSKLSLLLEKLVLGRQRNLLNICSKTAIVRMGW